MISVFWLSIWQKIIFKMIILSAGIFEGKAPSEMLDKIQFLEDN